MKKSLTFKFQYSKKDLYNFHKTYFDHTFLKWPFRLYGYPLLLIYSYYLWEGYWYFYIVLGFLFGLVFSFSHIIAAIATFFSSRSVEYYTLPLSVYITEREVSIQTDLSLSKRKWPLFIHYFLDQEHGLLLFNDAKNVLYVPKRAIAAQQFSKLQKILKEKVELKPVFKPVLKVFMFLLMGLPVFPLIRGFIYYLLEFVLI